MEQGSLVRLREEFEVQVDWRGFELHPETPRGGLPLTALFPPEAIPALAARLSRFAASRGIDGFAVRDRLSSTRRALAISELARDRGRLDAFRAAAMQAYWRDGKDLESDTALRAICVSAGLDPGEALRAADDPAFLARVDENRRAGDRAGVTGIPTLFVGGRVIVGAQPYEVVADAVLRAGARRRG